jgi:hypothetical protein
MIGLPQYKFYIGQPTPLYGSTVNYTEVEIPRNWEGVEIEFIRDKDDLEITRKYINNLDFYGNGARLLRLLMYTHGDSFINLPKLKIEHLVALKYETLFEGEIDTFNSDYDGDTLSAPITDSSLYAKTINDEGTEYELDVSSFPIEARLDGVGAGVRVVALLDSNPSQASFVGELVAIGQSTITENQDISNHIIHHNIITIKSYYIFIPY